MKHFTEFGRTNNTSEAGGTDSGSGVEGTRPADGPPPNDPAPCELFSDGAGI